MKPTPTHPKRCDWCGDDPLYQKYHDREWGVPLYDGQRLFELLCLEGAQAGLSWITILKKRENYRAAFDNFDAKKIVRYNNKKIAALLNNAGIVRNRLKIHSVIKNARAYLEFGDEEMSFSDFLWNYVDGKPLQPRRKSIAQVPASTPLSKQLSQDLKKRGFTFVGETICYAFMQSAGLINDHITTCHRHQKLAK